MTGKGILFAGAITLCIALCGCKTAVRPVAPTDAPFATHTETPAASVAASVTPVPAAVSDTPSPIVEPSFEAGSPAPLAAEESGKPVFSESISEPDLSTVTARPSEAPVTASPVVPTNDPEPAATDVTDDEEAWTPVI